MKKVFYSLFTIAAAALLQSCGGKTENVSFKEDVKPIIDQNCYRCHNSQSRMGDINFDNYETLMESRYFGKDQPMVVAGKPEESRIYKVITSDNKVIRMPPEDYGYDKLSSSDIETIEAWIKEGAKNN